MGTQGKNNPLIFVHHGDGDFQRPESSGGSKKEFGKVDFKIRQELSRELGDVMDYFKPQFSKNEKIPGVAKVILKEKALAKSHRPVSILNDAGCEVIGIGGIGELFLSVTGQDLINLQKIISTKETLVGKANISTIKEIKPYTNEDVFNIVGFEALRSRIRETGENLKFKLFNHQNKARDSLVLESFYDLVSQLGLPQPKIISYGENLEVYEIGVPDPDFLNPLAAYIGTKSLTSFPVFRGLKVNSVSVRGAKDDDFPVPELNKEYALVGVVDTGVNPSDKLLTPWIYSREDYIPTGTKHNYDHGSFVSGLTIGSKILNHNDARFPNISSMIVDVSALPPEGIKEDELLAILEETIPKYPEVKIWNLSLSGDEPCNSMAFSDLAVALDDLQDRYGIIFVIASGNYKVPPFRTWPTDIEDDRDKISSPGDSIRAITVGSVAHKNVASSRVKEGEPSPFSRRGPGPIFVPKPEVTHYGGNCDDKGNFIQTGVLSLNGKDELAEDVGTSFSAPIVSTLLANIRKSLGSFDSCNLAKALLIHSAALSANKLTANELRYYGFGVPGDLNNIFLCSKWQATSIFCFEIIPGLNFVKEFPIPKSLITQNGKTRGEFTITLSYDPPLDATFGSEYCRTNVEVSLGTYGMGKDEKMHHKKRIPLNPLDSSSLYEKKVIEHGFKWSPVKVYKTNFPNGVDGENWRLLVSVHSRSLYERIKPQKISVVVTVADPKKEIPVYSEFVNQARSSGWNFSTLKIQEQVKLRN